MLMPIAACLFWLPIPFGHHLRRALTSCISQSSDYLFGELFLLPSLCRALRESLQMYVSLFFWRAIYADRQQPKLREEVKEGSKT